MILNNLIENFYISNANRRFILKKAFQQESIKAPIKGWVGGKRKYSDFSCPLCNSNWVIKDGLRNKKERYKCRSCNKRFFYILE
ncbi:IS1/IS1595 family N-terminal zinc-binding domain-containing protein [Emticicia oligotrophica]|uniref:IS1/IS1595 family N-terminal zinc-binding domain-containing protein n=1 Tax=Emticicia oligotrophica TaxID=312279 RepID=UPI004042BAB6